MKDIGQPKLKDIDYYYPLDEVNGFKIRPGFYNLNGATAFNNSVNFTIHSANATACEVVLFHRQQKEPFGVIPLNESYRIGDTWSVLVFDIDIYEIEYCFRLDGPYDKSKGLIFDSSRFILDPYARAVTGQSVWGQKVDTDSCYHGRVCADQFDWGDFVQPYIPFSDLIIYELHVRGFTKDKSSGVAEKERGTFAGLMKKLPYLKELGVNCVELMPIFEFDELDGSRELDGEKLINYWGYNTTCFFAPNTSYSSSVEYNHEGDELKRLIKKFNENGIEVILDVVFNHTSEGDENGPAFSFKAIDNNVYYLLTPDGHYFNFSGCGNTFNCNHPVVQQFILDCLRYWVIEYRVDGFRFDLASILGRNEDGSPMQNPPLLKKIAYDPILSKVKLVAEAWDAGGLYQVGSFPSWNRWAEWNGKYRDDLRCFLKGDDGRAETAVKRIMGSIDLYNPTFRGNNASVNFLTCHDGFTLYDLYSYNCKHNEANGWENTDGDNSSTSWNCGAEGETDDKAVNDLRARMVKNAFTVLMCSRGAVMFLAGDEFCNTQFGNNNAYCQDNIVSWLDWNRFDSHSEIFGLVKFMIAFRKEHEILRHDTMPCSIGFPYMSIHNSFAWNKTFAYDTRVVGVMFAGGTESGEDDIVFLAVNAYWEAQNVQLPGLPENMYWNVEVNTTFEYKEGTDYDATSGRNDRNITLAPRSVVVLTAKYKNG